MARPIPCAEPNTATRWLRRFRSMRNIMKSSRSLTINESAVGFTPSGAPQSFCGSSCSCATRVRLAGWWGDGAAHEHSSRRETAALPGSRSLQCCPQQIIGGTSSRPSDRAPGGTRVRYWSPGCDPGPSRERRFAHHRGRSFRHVSRGGRESLRTRGRPARSTR